MSEITKACRGCNGRGHYGYVARAGQECDACSGTGRVPDVEVALWTQLDEANFERSTLRGGCDSLTNQLVAARAEVARLRDALAGSVAMASSHEQMDREIVRLTVTLAERDGEVARLQGREREAEDLLRDGFDDCREPTRTAAWLAGCKS